MARIRNFCIIAHIDHGKSTLADRLLEKTGTISSREMKAQVLDSMDLEREKGITIKAHPVRMKHRAPDGTEYFFHLIDTPGHVDFRYEVSRALAACEGAILVVDASQGVEAQTLANMDLAMEENLEIVPVMNKIDLPGADVEATRRALTELGFDGARALAISAKEGIGIDEILAAAIEKFPPPKGDAGKPLRALVFDSEFDPYLGAVVFVRLFDGTIRRGDKVLFRSDGRGIEVAEVGRFVPTRAPDAAGLCAGEVGYFTANIKSAALVHVGDTVTSAARPAEALAGYREPLPMVFAGIYPIDGDRYEDLRTALEKLKLNDAALTYEPESSAALAFGFRAGFLGLLHMDIIRERIDRHYQIPILLTPPSVEYEVALRDDGQGGKMGTIRIDAPNELPDPGRIEEIREPVLAVRIYTPEAYVGALMQLSEEKRGVYKDMRYLGPGRVVLQYEIPLAEVVVDFFDRLKSSSKGYASLDYEYLEHRSADLVRLDIRVNEEIVDALSLICHREKAYGVGRALCERLKELIPRQQFVIPVQAAVGSRIIARESIRAMGKDVTAKCYGGDITRKRKLLEKQKEGKRRMKKIGRVEIPQEAFFAVLGRSGGDA